MNINPIFKPVCDLKDFVVEQLFTVDRSLEGRVNAIAIECLKPLHFIVPGAEQFWAYQTPVFAHIQPLDCPDISHVWAYLTVIPATLIALILKVYNYYFNCECKDNLQVFHRDLCKLRRDFSLFRGLLERTLKELKLKKPYENAALPLNLTDFDNKIAQLEKLGKEGWENQQINLFCEEMYEKLSLTKQEGAQTTHSKKNRYSNILPWDNNRARTGKEGAESYINANRILGKQGTSFIASQGPKLITLVDHFRMILHEKVPVQVRLTHEIENGAHKCYAYWDAPKYTYPMDLGDGIQVRLKKTPWNEIKFEFYNDESNQFLHVCKQIDFEDWPDFGVPDIDRFMKLIDQLVALFNSPKFFGPVLVHCSAGVGRTGTLMACINLIREMRHQLFLPESERNFNVDEEIVKLRMERARAIQSVEQETFIYQVLRLKLAQYLTSGSELIVDK